jgi:phytoene dehydrogenase-like protein
VLKATKSASGIIGTFLGPRSPGSAYVLLHHYMGEIDGAFRAWGFQKGGTGGVSEAIAGAARSLGAEILLQAPVSNVIVKNGRAVGVALESGDEYHADVVLSGLDPKRTFLKLVDEHALPGDFVSSIRRFKARGSSGKVNLALSELPRLPCMEPANVARWGGVPVPAARYLRGAISVSPSLAYVESAFDDAKHGAFSRRPYMDVVIPSMIDPTMAPPGQHVMSIFCQYAPYNIDGGWDDAKREAFGDAVVDALAVFAPNIKQAIIARQVLTPADIERITGLTEGNIFQGELALDQLFFLRPAAGYARYQSPIDRLYQCGSGTHPGGGIMGASGRLAALTVLRDWPA